MYKRAVETGIKRLYHYETFNAEYLTDTLVNQRVHFSNPKNFNDPWDCNPWFDTARFSDPAYRTSCVELFQRLQMRVPGATEAQQTQYFQRLKTEDNLLKELIRSTTASTRNMITERWRIYCLTPLADTPLMWSHYSDKHRGICLEFDASQAVMGGAFEVSYNDTFPALDINMVGTNAVVQILLNKSADWRYENEYRILARSGETDNAPYKFLPITNEEFLPLTPKTLTAVIAGCQAPFDEIKSVVEKHGPGLPVKRMVRAQDKYSLSIQG